MFGWLSPREMADGLGLGRAAMGAGQGLRPMTDAEPDWLVAWREGRTAPRQAEPPPSGKPSSTVTAEAVRPKGNGCGFVEPDAWAYDGGVRREAVLDADHNPPRVVRRVGWQRCIGCGEPFWSEDVIRLRLCDGPFGCRGEATRPRNVKAAAP